MEYIHTQNRDNKKHNRNVFQLTLIIYRIFLFWLFHIFCSLSKTMRIAFPSVVSFRQTTIQFLSKDWQVLKKAETLNGIQFFLYLFILFYGKRHKGFQVARSKKRWILFCSPLSLISPVLSPTYFTLI